MLLLTSLYSLLVFLATHAGLRSAKAAGAQLAPMPRQRFSSQWLLFLLARWTPTAAAAAELLRAMHSRRCQHAAPSSCQQQQQRQQVNQQGLMTC
jgi:hypothetical protein